MEMEKNKEETHSINNNVELSLSDVIDDVSKHFKISAYPKTYLLLK